MMQNRELLILDIEKILSEFGDDTVLRYDTAKIITSVQGLVNRDFPRLYIMWQESDSFWLDYMMSEGKFLHGVKVTEIESYSEFLRIYRDFIRNCGIITWDYNVPATLNAAVTACGADGFIPVRYDMSSGSALSRLISETGAEIALDLHDKFTGTGIIFDTERKSSGSKKCDVYLWALEKYLDKTNKKLMFYTLDGISWSDEKPYYPDLGNAFVFNHDYAISKKAFVFDVSSYGDEYPCDDKSQPLGCDLATMKEILMRQYERTNGDEIITVCGFNPWQMKYTDYHGKGSHGGVAAEWQFTEVLSAYNCVKDADAYGYCGLANASVFTHYPLKKKYKNRKPSIEAENMKFDPNKTYVLFYVGDYDASAWTARHIPMWYKDKKLGKNPLMWCFNPNLSDRIPMAFDFIYENFTQNDFFEAGDSGAGYNNPYLLYSPRVHSELPDGNKAYINHNKYYFDKFDMNIIGFIINGVYPTDERQMNDIAEFAREGSGYNNGRPETSVVNGAVYMPHSYDISSEGTPPDEAAKAAVTGMERFPKEKRFHIFRTILTSPSRHDAVIEEMKKIKPEANFEFVDPHTFFRLAKEAVLSGQTF